MQESPRTPQRLGLVGWLGAGRRGLEAYLYILHRLSGVALLLFLSLHIFVTSLRLFGQSKGVRVEMDGKTFSPAGTALAGTRTDFSWACAGPWEAAVRW